jgi:hypothetical protein
MGSQFLSVESVVEHELKGMINVASSVAAIIEIHGAIDQLLLRQ